MSANSFFMIYTTVGHWQSSPECPEIYIVDASGIADAIAASVRTACTEAGTTPESCGLDPFTNTVVFEGDCKVVSTWAG